MRNLDAPQVDGEADHAAPTKLSEFLASARKAVAAFLASGVAGGFAPALADFDFGNLSWGNLWAGLLSGLVGSLLVYSVRNRGAQVGLTPGLENAIEQIITKRMGTFEFRVARAVGDKVNTVNDHVTAEIDALRPKLMVRSDSGQLRKPPPRV
jgi:hypothetical protein